MSMLRQKVGIYWVFSRWISSRFACWRIVSCRWFVWVIFSRNFWSFVRIALVLRDKLVLNLLHLIKVRLLHDSIKSIVDRNYRLLIVRVVKRMLRTGILSIHLELLISCAKFCQFHSLIHVLWDHINYIYRLAFRKHFVYLLNICIPIRVMHSRFFNFLFNFFDNLSPLILFVVIISAVLFFATIFISAMFSLIN